MSRWIPVSERLPEETGKCIVTAFDGVKSRSTYAHFQKTVGNFILTGRRSAWRVTAWMPMPEPYTKENTKAVWLEHYDWRSDKIYSRPSCLDCEGPIIYSGGQYVCMLCEEPVQVDDKMKEYISKVSEVKIDWQNCPKCGKKRCVETYYHINPATMEWETAHGKCVECGFRFIV